jgi:hypothetical protein
MALSKIRDKVLPPCLLNLTLLQQVAVVVVAMAVVVQFTIMPYQLLNHTNNKIQDPFSISLTV